MKLYQTYHIDTLRVSQYEGERIVSNVTLIEPPKRNQKKVLVYSPILRSNILVYRNDLKEL